jgi:hypothetical protein
MALQRQIGLELEKRHLIKKKKRRKEKEKTKPGASGSHL